MNETNATKNFKESMNLTGILTTKEIDNKATHLYSTELLSEINHIKLFISENNLNLISEKFDGEDYYIRFSK